MPVGAYAQDGSEDTVASTAIDVPHKSDEVIVVYEEQPSVARTFSICPEDEIEALGYQVTESLPGVGEDGNQAVVATVPDGTEVSQAIAQLEQTPGVAYAQPNYTYSLLEDPSEEDVSSMPDAQGLTSESISAEATVCAADSLAVVDDPYCTDSETNSYNQWYLFSAGITEAWDYVACEGSVTVAVLDTGCRYDHEDLAGTVDMEHAYDSDEQVSLSNSSAANGDSNGHGTHVCGLIGAQADNGTGIAGATYNATVLPIKVFSTRSNEASTESLLRAYSYLSQLIESGEVVNLRVANMSLGYYSSGQSTEDLLIEDAIEDLRAQGVLTVCAGGNGKNGIAQTGKVLPADFDACISVTSLDRDGGNTSYSDYNQYKDISAPGADICSTWRTSSSSYVVKSGTSMASPLVASTAALLWAVDPSLSVDDAVSALLDNADPVQDSEHDRSSTSGSRGALDADGSVLAVLEALGQDDGSSDGGVTVQRLYGETEFDTMDAVVSAGFETGSCNSVVVATASGYQDALTASALAGLEECPVLITDESSLTTKTAQQIERLGARTVYIVGGTAVVSPTVAAQLHAVSGVNEVVRLAGTTAADTAREVYNYGAGSWSQTAVVATSRTFQDALSVSPYAYAQGAPIFLTNEETDELDETAVAAIRGGGFDSVLIVGGQAVVSDAVENQLTGLDVERAYGTTAYDTSVEIAEWCLAQGVWTGEVAVATGEGYYDALTGSAYCGKRGGALVLASDASDVAIESFVAPHKASIVNVTVFGGTAVVSADVFTKLQTVVR